MGECILIIAVPVVLFVFAGRRADAAWGTSPGGMLLGFVLAALLSVSIIMKKVKQYDREYKALDKNN
jgi:F0F1-type ATP synthase assembly protein I